MRYADDAVGSLLAKLEDLGVLDDTAILVSSDHGEAFGELGVYADHQAADEATCHIPAVLRWPGVEPRVHDGLQYHLDVAATVLDLAGVRVPRTGTAEAIELGGAAVVTTWCCRRGRGPASGVSGGATTSTCGPGTTATTRTGPTRCSSTWPSTRTRPSTWPRPRRRWRRAAASLLDEWTATQLDRARAGGGPDGRRPPTRAARSTSARHLPAYLERLRTTGRAGWADVLEERHPDELGG